MRIETRGSREVIKSNLEIFLKVYNTCEGSLTVYSFISVLIKKLTRAFPMKRNGNNIVSMKLCIGRIFGKILSRETNNDLIRQKPRQQRPPCASEKKQWVHN